MDRKQSQNAHKMGEKERISELLDSLADCPDHHFPATSVQLRPYLPSLQALLKTAIEEDPCKPLSHQNEVLRDQIHRLSVIPT